MQISPIHNCNNSLRMKSAIKGAVCAMMLGTGVLTASGAFSTSKTKAVDNNYNVELSNKEYDMNYIKDAKSISELINRLNVIQANNQSNKPETFWDKKIREACNK